MNTVTRRIGKSKTCACHFLWRSPSVQNLAKGNRCFRFWIGIQSCLAEGRSQYPDVYDLFASGPLDSEGNIKGKLGKGQSAS